MATKAFILIETAVGKTKEVYSALRKLTEIQSIDAVTGPYDIIATIEGENPDAVVSFVTSKMHGITGINRTVTCISVHLK